MTQTTTPSGRDLLRDFLQGPPKRSQEWLANTIGTSQANVSFWLSGKTRPSDEFRTALTLVAGIPVEAWRTEEERAVIDRALRFVSENANEIADRATGTGD